jgi:hypothetical protein
MTHQVGYKINRAAVSLRHLHLVQPGSDILLLKVVAL